MPKPEEMNVGQLEDRLRSILVEEAEARMRVGAPELEKAKIELLLYERKKNK